MGLAVVGRKRYPSDQRRYFRMESPELADSTAEMTDAEFRAFILILAWANETKAHERGDWVFIARQRLASVAPNRRGSVATSARVVRELCTKQSWELREEGARWSIHVRNWSRIQGFTPAKLRPDSDETPSLTPTPTPTPTLSSEAPPKAERSAPDWALRASRLLAEKARKSPGGKVASDKTITAWARQLVGLARETPDLAADPEAHITAGIEWLFGPENEGEFALVVRSGSALREKWPRIVAAAKRKRDTEMPSQEDFTAQLLEDMRG